jgi:hypothetical protein
MVGIGLYIRLGILETPVFRKVLAEERVERVPVLEVLKRQPKQIALTALARMPEQAPGYIDAEEERNPPPPHQELVAREPAEK